MRIGSSDRHLDYGFFTVRVQSYSSNTGSFNRLTQNQGFKSELSPDLDQTC
jgi:hypothetical protein